MERSKMLWLKLFPAILQNVVLSKFTHSSWCNICLQICWWTVWKRLHTLCKHAFSAKSFTGNPNEFVQYSSKLHCLCCFLWYRCRWLSILVGNWKTIAKVSKMLWIFFNFFWIKIKWIGWLGCRLATAVRMLWKWFLPIAIFNLSIQSPVWTPLLPFIFTNYSWGSFVLQAEQKKYTEKGPKSDKSVSGNPKLHLFPNKTRTQMGVGLLDPLNPFKAVCGAYVWCQI